MPTSDLRHRPLHDDRGAIMVMGIFMCSCLVGAMWYLAGLGDAYLYRERMQEAADAMAFSDAALHARGMNLLVLINLIMAVILAIRVAIRVAKLVCTVAAVILAATAFFVPPNAALAAAAAAAATTLQSIDASSKAPIDSALNGLATAQQGIQTAGAAAANVATLATVGGEYTPVVRSAIAYRPVDVLGTDGLPAEKGSPDKLCAKAAGAIGDLAAWVIGKIPVAGPMLGDAVGMLTGLMTEMVGASPQYFCDLQPGASQPNNDARREQAAVDRCKDPETVLPGEEQHLVEAEKAWHERCVALGVACQGTDVKGEPLLVGIQSPASLGANSLDQQMLDTLKAERDRTARNIEELKHLRDTVHGGRSVFGGSIGGIPACLAWSRGEAKDHEDEQKQRQNQQQAQASATSQGTSGVAPMRVAKLRNGSPEGQFIGGVTGDDTLLRKDSKLVRIGAFGDKRTRPLVDPGHARLPAWAQAELYFDCSGAWDGADCNDDENAMWTFRWRPRLRRFDLDTDDTLRTLAPFLRFAPPARGPADMADDLAREAPAAGAARTNAALRRDLAESLQNTSVREHGVH